MTDTNLAYDYALTYSILDARGWSEDRIRAFLFKHQNESGYINSNLINKTK